MTNRITKTVILLLLALLAFLAIILLLLPSKKRDASSNADGQTTQSASEAYYASRAVYFDGEPYYKRENIDTLLIIGIDRTGEQKDSGSYNNDDRADFLTLLIVDHTRARYAWIPINRDTMTKYDRFDLKGDVIGQEYGQIALAHTYGSGLKDSCENTRNAVNYLLYNIGIDHYLSMTMDVVGRVNDAVGGVRVTFDRDYTDIDAGYLAGVAHTFSGDEAMAFVRSRSGLSEPTNTARMARQNLYLNALLSGLTDKDLSHDLYTQLYDDLTPYLVTDCDVLTFGSYFDALRYYRSDGALEIAGEAVADNEYMEFHIDNDSLKQLLKETFYQKIYLPKDTGYD